MANYFGPPGLPTDTLLPFDCHFKASLHGGVVVLAPM